MTVSRLTDRSDRRAASLAPRLPRPRPASGSSQPPGDLRRLATDLWTGARRVPRHAATGLVGLAAGLGLVLSLHAALAGEASLAAGLVTTSALAATLAPTGSAGTGSRVAGIDRALRLHRRFGVAAMVMVLVQFGIVLVDAPRTAGVPLLSPDAPPPLHGTTAAAVAIALMVTVAAFRGRLRPDQDVSPALHVLHVALAVIVVAGTATTVWWLAWRAGDGVTSLGLLVVAAILAGVTAQRRALALLAARTPFVVDDVRSQHAARLALRPADDRSDLPFQPGQVAWLRLDHPWGRRLPVPFALTSGADRPDRLELTALAAGDGQVAWDDLPPGRRVYVDGPHDPTDEHHQGSLLLVAADQGVSSMIAILRVQAARRDPRPHCLVVGGGTAADLRFRPELRRLAERLDLDVVEVLSRPGRTWTGRRGTIDRRLLGQVLHQHPSLTAPHAYVSGPAPMVTDITTALHDLGLSARRVHSDEFVPA